MKKILITALLSTGFFANAKVPKRCDTAILNTAYKAYKTECGGFGKKENCEVTTTKKQNAYSTLKVVCAYSGEPDYNDTLEAYYIVNENNCVILESKIEACDNF